MIVFVAEYPSDENIRDGMMIRIKEIDDKYAHLERTYLEISFFRKSRRSKEKNVGKLKVISLNFILDFFLIFKLLKEAKAIYIQALYNYVKVALFLNFLLTKKDVALDLHGAIPEELNYQNRIFFSYFYSLVEVMAFKRCNHFIHVTSAMSNHFKLKYSPDQRLKNSQDHILGIFTSYDLPIESNVLENIKRELNWNEQDVLFIYSGGIQDWQNVPLVIQSMKSLSNPRYKFLILTGSLSIVNDWVTEIPGNKIIVKSVPPQELKEYYYLADYGYALRFPNVVNKVSNPTKLGEYLAYGMVPIVIDPNIGDYNKMGFEYLRLDELNDQLPSVNSEHNEKIYKNYIQEMSQVRLPFLQF